jgi:DNA (cytosine-5)-methyltransferase 1
MKALGKEGRAPRVVALENVCGALTSHGGKDFEKICAALSEEGYRFGALVIDAALFVPQSRPRLFIVAVRGHVELPAALLAEGPTEFHPRALGDAFLRLPAKPRGDWLWWSLPAPAQRNTMLASVVEAEPRDVKWHAREKTQALVEKMSDVHLAKITAARASGERIVGALYRRTRYAEGAKLQRAEARFDGLAGCLRTPAGGSSRQFLMVLEGKRIRSRLISARETARLMGLPDDYILPTRYNDAYHLTGDGVVAPVVRHLAEHLFEPLLRAARRRKAA